MAFTPKTDVVSVPQSSATNAQPAAGEEWLITQIGGTVVTDASPRVSLYDGTAISAIIRGGVSYASAATGRVGIVITNSDYLRFTDVMSSGAQICSYQGVLLPAAIEAVTDIISVPQSSSTNAQPAAGEAWSVTQLSGHAGGLQTDGSPRVSLYDGTNASMILIGQTEFATGVIGAVKCVITQNDYLRWTDVIAGGARLSGYMGVKL